MSQKNWAKKGHPGRNGSAQEHYSAFLSVPSVYVLSTPPNSHQNEKCPPNQNPQETGMF